MIASFFCGRYIVQARMEVLVVRDTIVDTLRIREPILISERVVDTVEVVVPCEVVRTIHDTMYVQLPISQKEYKDSTYTAWVSGYRAQLDSIAFVQPTITETIIRREKHKRWGLGVIGGYGVGKNGSSPYIGVGVYYRVW